MRSIKRKRKRRRRKRRDRYMGNSDTTPGNAEGGRKL